MDSQAAFLQDLSRIGSRWDVLYIAEVDGRLSDGSSSDLFGGIHTWKRYWPGMGSYAFGLVFKNTFTGLVKSLKFCGRAASVVASVASDALSTGGNGTGTIARSASTGTNFCFLHGSHDDLDGTLSDVASLLKKGNRDF